jgi:hypothetical protein
MSDQGPARPKPRAAQIIDLRAVKEQPADLAEADALRLIRILAEDTNNIVVISHGRKQTKLRRIARRQIELCVQRGTITEGPFVNSRGNWQVNLSRHAAGEEVTCVVAIEWAKRLIVITAF